MKISNQLKHLGIFVTDYREFSFSFALAHFTLNVSFLPWRTRQKFHERAILTYLDRSFGHCFKQKALETETEKHESSKYVWVLWWQGEAQMPSIVAHCYTALKQNLPKDRNLILLDKDNYHSHIELPEYILTKSSAGEISITHLSDIIRFLLLEKFGGLWIDATVLTTPVPDGFFESDFFTLYAPGLFPCFISNGKWSSFLFYFRQPHHPFCKKMNVFFATYWRQQNFLIDYLLIDYAIYLILKNNDSFKSLFQKLPINRDYYWLNTHLNSKITREEYTYHLNCSLFHKLSYKIPRKSSGDEKNGWDFIFENSHNR